MQEYANFDRSLEIQSPLLQTLMENRTTLVKIAARITGCHSRGEDIVQDAFFRLEGAASLSLPLKAQINYVFRVVRNLALDHYRRQAMEQRHSGTEEEALNATNGDTPESANLHQETLNIIDIALSELPPRTRYAFEMYRLHGIQQKEIARTLGVSPTLVNFMIRDALIHCRETLKNLDP